MEATYDDRFLDDRELFWREESATHTSAAKVDDA
jgi:hypothetical protein